MANWSAAGYALTAAGRRLQAKVEAGATLALTKMAVGDGNEAYTDVDDLLDLVSPQVDISISSATVEGDVCKITGNLRVDTVSHGFWCREWGVFANDPDDGEILYLIALDSQPDWIPAGAEVGTSVTYQMNVAVANATTVTAQIDLTGLVDVEQLEDTTHTLKRMTTYREGDIMTAPNLAHGLVLECRTGGTTGEILVDLSGAKCGDTVADGTVIWHVARYLLTDSDSTLYRHFVSFVGCINTVVKALAKATPPIYAGIVSPDEPGETDKVWIQTEGGATFGLKQLQLMTDDGDITENPLMQMTPDDGSTVYLDPSGEIPAAMKALDTFDGGQFAPEPVDTEFATDEEVQEIIDEILPAPATACTATAEQMEAEEGGL